MARICVIILNYNGKRFLRPCVDSLLASEGGDFRLLVVDNASSDGSQHDLPQDPRLELLQNEANLYFAKGNNVGIEQVLNGPECPEYVFILNNDTQVHPRCLERLTAFMDAHPEAAGCQPALLFQANPNYVNSLGVRVSLSGRTWDAGFGQPYRSGQPPRPMLGITGGAMFLRAEVLRRTGGFCEYFTMYAEDVDLSLRIRSLGRSLWCVPEAKVLHAFGGTVQGSMPLRRLFYCERNGFYLVLRNFPPAGIARSYLLCVPLRLLIAGNALRQGRWRYAAGVLAATGIGLAALPWFACKRMLQRGARDYGFWQQVDAARLIPPKPVAIPPREGEGS